MSMVAEVGAYAASGGIGTVGTDIFEGQNPPEPDNLVSFFERPGMPPVRAHANKIVAERPGLQAVIRNTDYETGYAKARAVLNRFQNFAGVMGSTRYLQITASGGIHTVGTDELRRFLFSINFYVMKEPS